jgi:hypothetical protein
MMGDRRLFLSYYRKAILRRTSELLLCAAQARVFGDGAAGGVQYEPGEAGVGDARNKPGITKVAGGVRC